MTLTPERMAQRRAQHTRQPRPRMRPVTDDTARCLTIHDVSEPDDHPMYSELVKADEAERAAKMWEVGMRREGRFKR